MNLFASTLTLTGLKSGQGLWLGAEKVAPRMGPAMGEHSVEILRQLGYSHGAIARMIERGVTMPERKDAPGCGE